MVMKKVVAFGGAHVDRRARIHGETIPGASNPGHWFEEAGGGAFNVARNLARLGHSVTMISPRGGDAAADLVAAAARDAGVTDQPFIFLDRKTPSYTAILSEDGNLVIALADMDLYRLFSPRRLAVKNVRLVHEAADLVVCDANLPAETLAAIVERSHKLEIPVVAVAISPAKVVRFQKCLPGLDMLFLNQAEARALCPADIPATPEALAGHLIELGLSGAVMTNGSAEARAWLGDDVYGLAPPDAGSIGDVTGAGDAMASGVIHGLLSGDSLAEALKKGVACAVLTVRSPLATAENLSPETLTSHLALVSEPKILS